MLERRIRNPRHLHEIDLDAASAEERERKEVRLGALYPDLHAWILPACADRDRESRLMSVRPVDQLDERLVILLSALLEHGLEELCLRPLARLATASSSLPDASGLRRSNRARRN